MYFEHSTSVLGVEKKILSPPERLLGDLGQGTGLRALLVWLGSLRFPGNEAVMAGRGSSDSSCRAKVGSSAVHTHTHTHTHSHLLPQGSLFHLLHLCPIHGDKQGNTTSIS